MEIQSRGPEAKDVICQALLGFVKACKGRYLARNRLKSVCMMQINELVSPACGTRPCDCWRELACMIPTLLRFGAQRARGKDKSRREGGEKKDVDFVRLWTTHNSYRYRYNVEPSPAQPSPIHACASRPCGGSHNEGS